MNNAEIGKMASSNKLQVKQKLDDALIHHRAGRLPEAEKLYREILGANPNHVEALHLLGLIGHKMGAHDAAIDLMGRAAKQAPNRADILSNMGVAYSAANRYEEAIQVLQRAASLGDFADIQFNLGNAYQGISRHAEAAAAYVKAIEKAPEMAGAWLNLGISLIHLRQPEEAINAFDRHLSISPLSSKAKAMKLHAYCMQGRVEEANRLFNFTRHVQSVKIDVPGSYTDIHQFNGELEVQIRSRPGLRQDFKGIATRNGRQALALQVDSPSTIRALEMALRPLIDNYISSQEKDLVYGGIGLVQGRPYMFNINATILDAEGYQESHIHPNGVVSGVYYVRIPREIAASPITAEQNDDKATAGWLELGRPGRELPQARIASVRRVKPEEGRVYMFPSHIFHRTIPFQSFEPRISVAFDVQIPNGSGSQFK